MRFLTTILLVLGMAFCLSAQVNYTANTQIKPYTGDFRAAMNLGYYPPFNEEQLAILSAGSTSLGVEGIGIKALRPLIPENFTEVWGQNFKLNTLKQYQTLGIAENTTIVGFPVDWHRDATKYRCPNGGEVQSELFSNLYTDIWDGGANGTPYNDNNYYAAYLYKTVQMYKPYVKFWEIWNEPGFDFTGQRGWRQPGDSAGNWWDSNPDPCDYKLRAPIFHFIRILHISYEIIKTIDPDAYVVLSGVGYASFLDAVCRNTENPNGGGVTPQYPLKGGAYFDVVGFHSYPHFDGSLREWNNAKGAFDNFRHSDAAARGILKTKNEFQTVLTKYGYNAATYPEKLWIITECNVPRKGFTAEWGSPLIQRNFTMKAYFECVKSNFIQNHFYKIADDIEESRATDDFDVMGFYLKPDYGRGFQQDVTEEGIALKTCTDVLFGRTYDAAKTAQMALPNNVKGGAFKGKDGSYAYMLWAETTIDKSEEANATYSFPSSFGNSFSKKEWNYGYTHRANNINGQSISLSATPVFITAAEANPITNYVDIALSQTVSQATASNGNIVTFTIKAENKGNLNATGVTVRNVLPEGFDYVTPVTANFNNGEWAIGNLSVGNSASISIQVRVNSITQQVSNIAQVQSLEQKDDNISNNTAIMGINPAIAPRPTKIDMEMAMSVDRNNFVVGELINYTVTVVNQEDFEATNVVVDVPFKLTNFTPVSGFSTKGLYDFNTSTWTIPNVKFREAVTLKVTLRITNTTPIRHFVQIKSVDQADLDSNPNNGEQPLEDDQSIISIPNDGNPCYDDAAPPRFLTCPKDFTVAVSDAGGYVQWLTPTVKDNCGNPVLSSNYQAGAYFAIGSYPITYTATDNKGLKSTCTFTIKVEKKNITPPTDNKPDLELTMSVDKPNLPIYSDITFTVKISNKGTAAANNINVSVPINTEGALVHSTTNDGKQLATKGTFQYWNPQVWTVGSLAVGETATLTYTTFSLKRDPITIFAEVKTQSPEDLDSKAGNGKQNEDDEASVTLPSGTTNVCDNDNTAPTFSNCPKDITLTTEKNTAIGTWTAPTASDNCSASPLSANCAITPCVTVVGTYTSGFGFPIGTTTVTYIATDAKGNQATCSFKVTVRKNDLPTSVDLEIKVSAASQNFRIYTPFTINTSVANLGTEKASNIKIDIPYPAGCVQGGQNKTSIGFYTGYWADCTGCGLWYIPELAAGQTATLELPVFPLDANGNKTATAKVLSLDQTDGNSSNNEASFTVSPSPIPQAASLKNVREFALTASPNPFSETLELQVLSIQEKEANILIYNNLGRLIKSEKKGIAKGINSLKVDCLDLNDGFYFVVLKMPNVKDMYVKVLKVGE
jgi:uncharacterized repeat protein (TIGR01451 family)